MKKNYFLFFATMMYYTFSLHAEQSVTLAVSSVTTFQTPLAIIVLESNPELLEIAKNIKKAVDFSQQFTTTILPITNPIPHKNLLTTLHNLYTRHATPLCVCINKKDDSSYEWRIYDTLEGNLIAGKKYKKKGTVARGWAYAMADKIIGVLTGTEGSFSSRITYCAEKINAQGKRSRALYVADFDGSNAELLLADSAVIISPRWNVSQHNPLIFYSEYANTNIQLKSISFNKTVTIASDLEGINMLPCFSPDGKSVVYCASNGKGNCQLYHHTKDKLHCFTRNNGNNVSPSFIDNEQICFCSDAQTGQPQIYIGNLKTGHVQRITHAGYCSAPSYCAANNTLLYHKKIEGIIQICLYDCKTKQHTTLTHDKHSKHSGCWSARGDYILYTEGTSNSKLVNFNVKTSKKRYIKNNTSCYLYPSCSPVYTVFPTVV